MIYRIVFALLCSLPPIAGADSALELKGMSPGMSKSTIQYRMPELQCTRDAAARASSTCTYIPTNPHQRDIAILDGVGPVPAEAWNLRFDHDVLSRMLVTFDSAAFDKVVTALRMRFGSPTESSAETLYTRQGTPRQSRRLTWRRDGRTLVATELAGRLSRSTVSLVSDGHAGKSNS